MKKYITTAVFLAFFATNLFGQEVKHNSWSDGDSTDFENWVSSEGVVIDSTVRLIPINEIKNADTFQFILYGESDIWPVQEFPISSAHDVDYISENKQYYLITDGFGRRVFEINYTNPDNPIEAGFSFTGDQLPLVNPVDASTYFENGNRKVLITDNGGHRVIKVDRVGGDEEWAYGDGTSGIGPNQLSGPSDAIYLSDSGHIIICDQGNSRIIEVNPATNEIGWTYTDGDEFNPVDIEHNPMTNEVLITDQKNHRVFLLQKESKTITWEFGTTEASETDSTLNSPTDADLLPNDNILICDSKNDRLLEVNRSGEIVWSFQHRPLINLRDADRLPDNRTIVIADYPPLLKNIPIWLGYSDSMFVSVPQALGKKANFDSLFWSSEIPQDTELKIQIRSAANLTELEAALWHGPTETDSFFVNSPTKIDPENHSAHTFFQFRAFLNTTSELNTPALKSLSLKYHYFDDKQLGTIRSDVIQNDGNSIITQWLNLEFETLQSETRSVKISILNAATGEVLKDFFAEGLDTVNQNESLSIWEKLRGVQAIQLRASLQTTNTAATPQLDFWKINWQSTESTTSEINFVDEFEETAYYYRVSPFYLPAEKEVDQVSIKLTDQNIASVQDTITVHVRSLLSEDYMDVLLERQASPLGSFLPKRSIPAGVLNFIIPGNASLEVFDRDTLVVSYIDPTDPQDQSSDSVLIVQNSTGEIQIVDTEDVPQDTFAVNDSIFVLLTGEFDQNIDSRQDTIYVDIFDNETDDIETAALVEIADTSGVFYTGNFKSAAGIPLVLSATGIPDDSQLQTMRSNQIAVRYIDNFTLQDLVYMEKGPGPPPQDSIIAFPDRPLDFDIAPNPFYLGRNSILKLRASSNTGDLSVHKIEIYNIAGQRVRSIPGSTINFSLSQPIPRNTFAYTDIWWDMKNENSDNVKSGTYWVKMYGSFTDERGVRSQELNYIKKVVIIR